MPRRPRVRLECWKVVVCKGKAVWNWSRHLVHHPTLCAVRIGQQLCGLQSSFGFASAGHGCFAAPQQSCL